MPKHPVKNHIINWTCSLLKQMLIFSAVIKPWPGDHKHSTLLVEPLKPET